MPIKMKYHYCTLFDKNYLSQVLSLCDSLEKHVASFIIYCLCMDDESFQYMQCRKNTQIVPISSVQLETFYPELLIAKSNRDLVEYYFTCSSALCSYIFDCYPQTELLTYLDADLYFFSSPEPIYEELKEASIGIIEHKFTYVGKKYEKYGKFNVGWVSFRNNVSGRKCLEDWKNNCIEWCYDRLENGKFGDQKYLDNWFDKYKGVHIIQHSGANLAPWNVGNYSLSFDSKTGQILVNSQNLIFYHFAGLKQVSGNSYITHVSQYFVKLSGILRNTIYTQYIYSIRKFNSEVGIEFNIKNRKAYDGTELRKHARSFSRKLRQYIYNDYIEVS